MVRTLRRLGAGLALCALALASSPASAQPGGLDEARRLLEADRAQQAYELLAPLEPERAGEPDYDFLLGVAALESGRPNEAIFALERVLAVDPDHVQARTEIARAYFDIGETRRARSQFEEAGRDARLPSEVQANVDRYLDAIDQRIAGVRRRFQAYIEAIAGFDTNVNSATGDSEVAVPALGGLVVQLAPTGVEEDDAFLGAAAAAAYVHPIDRRFDLIAGAGTNLRENVSVDGFDTGTVNGYAGVAYNRDDDRFSLAAQAENFQVDGDTLRNAFGATGQWSHELAPGKRLSAYAQYTRLLYPGQRLRDADRVTLGAGYSRHLPGPRRPVVFGGAYVGREDEREHGVQHLGHEFAGVRLGGQLNISERAVLYGSASLELREYGGPDPLFLATRDDDRVEIEVGVHYRPAPKWRITPRVKHVEHSSNIALHDHDRTLVSITVRREFGF